MPVRQTVAGRLGEALRDVGRSLASAPVRLALFAALALWAAWPLLQGAGARNAYRDAEVLHHYEEAARVTVLQHHQLPLWDPYYCGGLYGLGTPQSRFASPTFLLTLIFGTSRGEALTVFFMLVLGLEGTFRYLRSRGASAAAACFAAPIFALSGTFAVAPMRGWINFMGFLLLPWVLLGVRAVIREKSLGGAVLASASLAWIVGFGGTYAAPMATLLVGFELAEALSYPGFRRGAGERIALVAATGLLAAGLALVRLWPVAETLAAAPRILGGNPAYKPMDLMMGLLRRMSPASGDADLPGTFLVGIGCVPAVILGLLRGRRATSLVVLGVLLLWVAAGYSMRPSLFGALRTLPIFSALRYPERYLTLFGLVAAALAAHGYDVTRSLGKAAPRLRVGSYAVAFGLVANLPSLVGNMHDAANARLLEPEPIAAPGEFKQARGTRWGLAHYLPMQRGCLSCWDAYPVPQSRALRGDLTAEEYLADPGAGSVTRSRWSPNALSLHAEISRPTTLVVNQNHHPGFSSNVGLVRSERGLLAVDLPPGIHDVELRFRPRSAVGGGLALLFASAVAVLLLVRSRRTPRVEGARQVLTLCAVCILPLVPALLVRAVVAEAAPVRALETASGEPVVTDAPGPDVRPLRVVFGGGASLVGARVARLDSADRRALPEGGVLVVSPGDRVEIELDFRVDAEVPGDLAVSLQGEGKSGDKSVSVNADHPAISSVLLLSDAPRGKILRDVTVLTIPDALAGATVDLHAGLYGLRRNGQRQPVQEAGGAKIVENRAVVASLRVRSVR